MGGYGSDYGSSRDYDFSSSSKVTKKSARDYAKDDNREYKTPTKGLGAPIGKDISTNSNYSLTFVVDVTGSMAEWPRIIFDKIPTLYSESNAAIQGANLKELEGGKKLEDLLEMSVIAVGDANYDKNPIQVVDYSKGANLVKGVKSIYPEGGGGPFGEESYELVAYFLDKHWKGPTSNNMKPLLVFACDEDFYRKIDKDQVKGLFGDDIKQSLNSDEVVKRVLNKFDSYVLRPEPNGECAVYNKAESHWKRLLEGNSQKVLKMNDPKRLVDCVIGICGYASNNFEQAEALLKRRQTSSQVDEVLATLHPLLSSKGRLNK